MNKKRVHTQTAKQLLEKFPKLHQRQFAKIATNDETWVHYFKPVRKIGNKIWLSKHGRRPAVAKRTMSTKKVLYAIFFSCDGIAIQILVPKSKSATGRYYCDVLKKLKKCYQKRCPVTGFQRLSTA